MNVSLITGACFVGLAWFRAPSTRYMIRNRDRIMRDEATYASKRYIIAGVIVFAVLLILGLCLGPINLGPLGRWP